MNAHDEAVLAQTTEIAQLAADLRRGKLELTKRDRARLKSRLTKLYGTVLGGRDALVLTDRR